MNDTPESPIKRSERHAAAPAMGEERVDPPRAELAPCGCYAQRRHVGRQPARADPGVGYGLSARTGADSVRGMCNMGKMGVR